MPVFSCCILCVMICVIVIYKNRFKSVCMSGEMLDAYSYGISKYYALIWRSVIFSYGYPLAFFHRVEQKIKALNFSKQNVCAPKILLKECYFSILQLNSPAYSFTNKICIYFEIPSISGIFSNPLKFVL